jgi:hypothetical protein
MMDLRADGFAVMAADVAERARHCAAVGEAVKVAVTLDSRLPVDVGWAALTVAEQALLTAAECCRAQLAPPRNDADQLVLTRSGRLRVHRRDSGSDPEGHILGSVAWPAVAAPIDRLWRLADEVQRAQQEELARALAAEPEDARRQRLAAIGYALVHMAPVLFYVGGRVYSNLGELSNLPGKSLRADAPESILRQLADDRGQWDPEDATFVACLAALIASGPAVRVEEFNGTQLVPDTVEAFLAERIAAYDGDQPDLVGLDRLTRLDRLAVRCADLRKRLLAAGAVFYRSINGLNLHKREEILRTPVSIADVPPAVCRFIEDAARRADAEPLSIVDFDAARSAVAAIVAGFPGATPPAGFSSPFEAFLHDLLGVVAEVTAADVAMGRGPKFLGGLADATPAEEKLRLGTKEFYCCVAPRRSFATRFASDRATLVKVLAAYSARMRYNTWHYWPHAFGLHELGERDDWFFAPTMPDIAEWSDQRHTGHIMFGVRYAIRIPIGIHFGGDYRPGLYDLRLMRTSGPPFELSDLRAAIAVGRLLELLHQDMSSAGFVVSDFGNDWYRRFYG